METFTKKCYYAFQPIVNIYTGKVFAFEVLIRNTKEAGFKSISEVFDRAYKQDILYTLDIQLRKIAFKKFSKISFYKNIKIFYNLDNRIALMKNFKPGRTKKIAEDLHMGYENVCFEISEKNEGVFSDDNMNNAAIEIYQNQNYKIAIDDFGTGFSGLKMLYSIKPDFLKIDRFFISDIHKNQ